jgi:hypothetical protein
MSKKILREELSWEHRVAGLCGCLRAVNQFLVERDTALLEEFSGSLAKQVIDALGSPPIIGFCRAQLYFASSDPAYRAAAVAWQKIHSAELFAFQALDLDLLNPVGGA